MKDQAIFTEALELDPTKRPAYLDIACAGNPALREQVEGLLEAHENAGSFIDRLDGRIADFTVNHVVEKPGFEIGPYKLREIIGEGGFGIVYVAEQLQPVRRKVALKIIKPGMDTKEVIARFEAERQALALMDHPNVARVIDAGATDSGRPYFVMELVHGIPIDQFATQTVFRPINA